jgi:Skp family chaperone for outer membrane proteins
MLLLSASGVMAEGGTTVAVIDMDAALRGYSRTKAADRDIERQKGEFKIEIERMTTKLGAMEEEYGKVREAARSAALSADAREKRLETAESKLMALKEYEQKIRKYADTEKRRLLDLSLRIRKRFKGEIKEVVDTYARDNSIELVLDMSSSIPNWQDIVVFRDKAVDITGRIIGVLNEADKDAGAGRW